ncbi:MAG: hypothetical protein M9948_08975 [Lentimicrobium sp.]|nr:hypothetical protein [Lentimicrobium sp.]
MVLTRGLIFQGNDGGVTLGIDSLNRVSWGDISRNGLNITQYYGLGIPADGSDYLVGGTQDGNFFKYHNGVWPNDIEIGDCRRSCL